MPLFHLIAFAAQYYIDVPFFDQWGLVASIEKYIHEEISLKNLWEQGNVHRIFFPKLIMFSLAKATYWNMGYEIAVILICGLFTYLIIISQVIETYRQYELKHQMLGITILLLAILIFSLSQFQNWLWGMQIQILLNVMVSVAGFSILSKHINYQRVIIGVVLGFVATHSFANGIMYWFVGLMPLLFAQINPVSLKKRAVIIWIVCGGMAIFSFFYDYKFNGNCVERLMHEPIKHILYGLVYLGSPISRFNAFSAAIVGTIGFFLFGLLSMYLIKKYHMHIRHLLPYICFSCYAIGSAITTAIGRGKFGYQQALSSRYITIGQLLWVTNIIFLGILYVKFQEATTEKFLFIKKLTCEGLLLVLIPFIIHGYILGMNSGKKLGKITRNARQVILLTYPDVELKIIKKLNAPRPEFAMERLVILYQNKLSLFRHLRTKQETQNSYDKEQ